MKNGQRKVKTVKTKEIRKWNKDSIQNLLETNDTAVLRALVAIFKRQTDYEQGAERTYENNGVGFTGWDGELLSSFAKQVVQRGTLSPKQMQVARKRMKRYWGQLAEIAAQNGMNPAIESK